MKSIIAANTKKLIREKGLKQCTVAKLAGFNEKEFSNMLNGRKTIKGDDVWSISKALGVTPNDICRIKTDNEAS